MSSWLLCISETNPFQLQADPHNILQDKHHPKFSFEQGCTCTDTGVWHTKILSPTRDSTHQIQIWTTSFKHQLEQSQITRQVSIHLHSHERWKLNTFRRTTWHNPVKAMLLTEAGVPRQDSCGAFQETSTQAPVQGIWPSPSLNRFLQQPASQHRDKTHLTYMEATFCPTQTRAELLVKSGTTLNITLTIGKQFWNHTGIESHKSHWRAAKKPAPESFKLQKESIGYYVAKGLMLLLPSDSKSGFELPGSSSEPFLPVQFFLFTGLQKLHLEIR